MLILGHKYMIFHVSLNGVFTRLLLDIQILKSYVFVRNF